MSKLVNYKEPVEVVCGPDDIDWDYAPMPEMRAMKEDVEDLCIAFDTLKSNLNTASHEFSI